MEQQNFEVRAAHNDLHAVEEHIHNFMASIESGPDKVDIPTRFLTKGEWEFDLDAISDELDDLEKRAKPRQGPFGELPAFLCVSIEADEQEKAGGRGFNIPKPKRKPHVVPSYKKDLKKPFAPPTFSIEANDEDGRGFFTKGKPRHVDRRRSSQFLEPPEADLDSLEILSDK